MTVSNNLNTMVNLEDNLNKSAQNISKISNTSNNTNNENKVNDDLDIAKEIVKQIEIPIAYTANAEVISTQNSIHKTLLDIKA